MLFEKRRPDSGTITAEHAGQASKCRASFSKLLNFLTVSLAKLSAQLCCMLYCINPSFWSRSTLGFLVGHVVKMCAKKEVFWVRALRVVAGVKNMQISGVTLVDDPRSATSSYLLGTTTGPDHSVALVRGGFPFPASICLDDLRPKALLKTSSFPSHGICG